MQISCIEVAGYLDSILKLEGIPARKNLAKILVFVGVLGEVLLPHEYIPGLILVGCDVRLLRVVGEVIVLICLNKLLVVKGV